MSKKNLDNLIFIDTETTGVEKEDRLFQVAYKFQGAEQDELFKPPLPISIEAMEVTHITNKEVEKKSVFINSKMHQELQNIFKDNQNIFVAHNAKFDLEMLQKEGVEVKKYIDTLKIAQYLDTEAKIPSYRMQYLRYFLSLEVKDAQAHNALGDIRVLEALFLRLFEKMLKEYKNETEVLDKMVEISQQPILIKRFNFGMHQGRLVEDVAKTKKSYLEWLSREKKKDAAEGKIDED